MSVALAPAPLLAPASAGDQVTIYRTSDMMGSVVKYEGKLVAHGCISYAQYENAPRVSFIPKGKRKARGIQETFRPYLLILKGYGHPDPDKLFSVPVGSTVAGVTVTTSKYSSFDEGFVRDFNRLINPYIEQQSQPVVVADYRYEKE